MAVITKTTATLNINILDTTGSITTWKINDPVEGLSFVDVSAALAGLRLADDSTVFCNSAGHDLVDFKSAEYETIVKTTEPVE